ncbi:methylated-DNA/protein-cysteine methyltransferase [Desulfovibrio sp. X2]|uniref:bifunctional DNA-binding transcriptional regulator/O6-methylguanine-DNA methyltransferase Ada n=1 Tax=Desulfovibrio sp. X2 TaxID=941449 RepID=UPI000358B10F|nr:bifunctional DNA-binding transcriptional regulator/O6-methylguanine-DNA methyltransferase Ada [Desulfovibrio sp. X2]EPR44762.1 methylated-DNA/protein-cysteine methyltransferase [Desulfovibrio sp. X2]
MTRKEKDAPAAPPLDDARWARLLAQKHGADDPGDGFVYGVTTTGVYCRPGCPARLPRRENAVFFANAEAAEAAGFRPCKRCRPDAPDDTLRAGEERKAHEAVRRALALLDAAESPPRLAELAAAAGCSPSHFHRLFKKTLGATPGEYFAARRLRRLQQSLAAESSVTGSLYAAGYGSSSRLYERDAHLLGMPPKAYGGKAAGGEGQEIAFAAARTSLGWVLVAATRSGICNVEFGDDPAALEKGLRERFPRAVLREDETALSAWLGQIAAFVESPAGSLDLPLDVAGTLFQQKVWKALQKLPPGTTVSYAELARLIGRPGAARAVGRACGANRHAVLIPCHRAVGGSGKLVGYRWGLDRKQALLAREKAARDAEKGVKRTEGA